MLWFFFALLLPGSGQRLRVRQVGRVKGWLDEDGIGSLENMRNDWHQELDLVLIALCGKINNPAITSQLELHRPLYLCGTRDNHHKCGGHIREVHTFTKRKTLDGWPIVRGCRDNRVSFLFIRDALFTEDWLTVLGFRLTSICECASLIKGTQYTIYCPVWDSVVLTRKLPDGR